ncbi:MAG: hypothetical protein WEC75_02365 [Dehalococcoidia bacterium]
MNDVQPAPASERLDMSKTRVRVFTPSGLLEGDHHHPPGVRLSNSLRNTASSERYMLLTDVTIRSANGIDLDEAASKAPFVLINTTHASVIVPLEEAT